MRVAADLVARGCRISIPFGEDSDYDLIADYWGRLHRVQVKFTTKRFTSAMVPALNGQRSGVRDAREYLHPDLAADPLTMEPAGIEPATSALQTPRSAS